MGDCGCTTAVYIIHLRWFAGKDYVESVGILLPFFSDEKLPRSTAKHHSILQTWNTIISQLNKSQTQNVIWYDTMAMEVLSIPCVSVSVVIFCKNS